MKMKISIWHRRKSAPPSSVDNELVGVVDMMARMNASKFTIDDAFDENLDDVVVRVYGSTTTSVAMDNNSPFYGRPRTLTSEARPQQQHVRCDRIASAPTHANSQTPSHPVLLSIKTGILPDDVNSPFIYSTILSIIWGTRV